MLKKPRSKVQPLTRTVPELPPSEPLPTSQKEQTLEKARIVFGSKLGGPLERRKEIEAASQVIAGVSVPPKPAEPDNCCMSGCVNCVWDMYRDDMEEWAEKSAQARSAMQAQRQTGAGSGQMVAGSGESSHVATSMDDDGGGSESNWSEEGSKDSSNLFDDIPVGIREFMRTEKKLKMQQKKAQAAAA
jgi:predicted  nucleic acid-binding Zn-ribbon protein